MTLQQADQIASYYSYLVGGKFQHEIYGECNLDSVEPYKMVDGDYTVIIKYDIFKTPCIPEFYGFQCPRKQLLLYLLQNAIAFEPKKFGLD